MAGHWDDTEPSAPASDNSPRRGESRSIPTREFTWPIPEIAASWRCRCNETVGAPYCFPARSDLDRQFARRDVPVVADAVVRAGGLCAFVLRINCDGRL